MASEEERDLRPWSDLPIEILELIVSKLPCFHIPYFVSVCKNWSQVDISSVFPIQSPLLLHNNGKRGKDICRYYDPSTNMTFIVDSPFDLSGYEFYFAKDGWLLLYKEYEVVLANPITGIFRKFPPLLWRKTFTAFLFTGSPLHDCKLYGIDSTIHEFTEITTWDKNAGWDENRLFDNNQPFVASQFSNLVCYRNLIYCLGSEGNLGVYDPTEETWTVFSNPRQFVNISYEYSYLVESKDEQLVVVLIEDNGMPIHIYRLDRMEMQWVKIKTLKDQSLFAESRMSLLTTPLVKKMRNQVYLPRVHGVLSETCMAEVKSYRDRLFFVSKKRGKIGEEALRVYTLFL